MKNKNLILITCHDLGRHLGCYGHSTVQSPNLDRLAAEGVLFEQSFGTAPQCSPSRAGLHTGRYPHAAGMLGLAHPPFGWELYPGEKVIAERLEELGYNTALVGEQHLSSSNRRLGYQQRLPLGPAREMSQAAIGLLTEMSRQDQPFYLEIGYHEPHRPYEWGGAQPDNSQGVDVPEYLPDCVASQQDFSELQGAVRALDEGIGVVLAGLEAAGLAEDTWLLFTTDHGVAMPRAKGTLYDPGIETALLLRWPAAGVRPGRYNQLISNVDIVPTIMEGLGLPAPADSQGQSFWPLLAGQPYQPRQEIFAEKTYHQHYEPMRCIRTTTHKLVVNMEASTKVDVPSDARHSAIYPVLRDDFAENRQPVELYDLQTDPWETTNLAGQPAIQAIEEELRARLRDWMVKTADPILKGPVPSPYYHDVLAWLTANR